MILVTDTLSCLILASSPVTINWQNKNITNEPRRTIGLAGHSESPEVQKHFLKLFLASEGL